MDRIAMLKEMIKSGGTNSFLQHALALEYIKSGNDAEAEKLFTDLLKKEPEYIGSYYHLGKLLERNGHQREAMSVYEEGITYASGLKDFHSLNELRSALNSLADDLND
jgi:Tfp pilus assembly protein PilF